MLLQPDCIPCILAMSVSLLRKRRFREARIRELSTEILKIPALTGCHWDITSPEVIEQVMNIIVEAAGDPDPFSHEKADLNNALLDRYDFFKGLLTQSDDPFYTAAKLSIIGNAIDFMVPDGTSQIEKTIMEKLEAPMPSEHVSSFKEKLDSSKRVLYFGDNAGEIVLDKLFIETLRQQHPVEVVFVVRSVPTLNDSTITEAIAVGMDKVATTVIANGIDGPLPGTVLDRCSDELKGLVNRADVIVAKGGGNFDTLSEEKKILDKTTFMLLSKCFPYNRHFNAVLFQPILTCASSQNTD